MDSTNLDHATLCIPLASFGFSGDAFLHLGEVPSVQVSPHHWRVSDSHRKGSILGTPINMSPQRYIGFSGDTQQRTDKALMDQGLEIGKSSRRLDPLQNPKYVAPSWDEVYGTLVDLASEIRLSGYNPQVIIGVTAKRPKITQPVTSEVSGKRVLVVDDVADSGHSLRVAFKHLARKGAREIRVCTLYLKPKSVFKPNHYARTTSKWVIFPWERLEAINLIKRNLRSDGRTYEIIRELKGSGLSGTLIRKLLALDQ